jgi:hypothetical protein
MKLLRAIGRALASLLRGDDMINEARNNRLDVKSIDNPMLQGGSQDWMTWRRRDTHTGRML